MQAKSLGIAALGVAVPPIGIGYLSRDGFDDKDTFDNNQYIKFGLGFLFGGIVNVLASAVAEVSANYVNKPIPEVVYQIPEITVRYDAEAQTSAQEEFGVKGLAQVTTLYGIIEPFFRDRTYSPITELSVTPSPDYSCQWRIDGHVPLEKMLEPRQHLNLDPEVLLGNKAASDKHIVDYARETCLTVLAEEGH